MFHPYRFFATLLHVRIKVAGKVCAEAVHILYKGVFMTIRMSLICLVIISSSCLGQSKVKLVVNVEEDIYKTVTNKKEIAEMGAGGHFEKFYKKQKMKLGSSFNVDRATFLNAIISGKNDTVSFKIIEKSTGNIVYQLDSISINGNYEIPGSDLNDAISAHTVYDSGECSTWDEIYNCDLVMLIYTGNKVVIKKQFNIYPIIG